MNSRPICITGLAIAAVSVALVWMIKTRNVTGSTPGKAASQITDGLPASEPVAQPMSMPSVDSAAPISPVELPLSAVPAERIVSAQETNTQPNAAKVKAKKKSQPKPPLQDPTARVALSWVGVDPVAEAYWLDAIYDSGLPDNEREDLMEDLNEVGFSDPHHPGQEDLPLIVNRLGIIEEVLPYADEFMLPHLAEAYKDLVGMLNGQSPP